MQDDTNPFSTSAEALQPNHGQGLQPTPFLQRSAPVPVALRETLRPDDVEAVHRLTALTGIFPAEEVEFAREMAAGALAEGPGGAERFIFAERGTRTLGYACFGRIPGTRGSYELHWLAVDPACQGQGVGRLLLRSVEEAVRREGGRKVFLETYDRAECAPTHRFYERCGYTLQAHLQDYFAPGEGALIYARTLADA